MEIENVKEPNLFEEIFRYDWVPVMQFEEDAVEINRPEEIWITDTTFRDGQQARAPYEVEQIVQLYKYLHELGGKKVLSGNLSFYL